MATILFENRTTDGTSDYLKLVEPFGAVAISGTFDGASVAIEASLDDGTTYIVSDTLTVASIKRFEFVKNGKMRAVISSAGASTSLTIKIITEV